MRRLLLVCLLVVAAACSDDGGPAVDRTTSTAVPAAGPGHEPAWLADVTTAPTEPGWPGGSWSTEEVGGRTPLAGFGEVAAVITAADGTTCEVCLLAATSSDQTSRGLMYVTDEELGGYDGMLFAFEAEVSSGFWMRNTLIPLSIAYFDSSGELVSQTDMQPCTAEAQGCPVYPAAAPFRLAIEVPRGRLPDIGVVGPGGRPAEAGDATIELLGTPCPEA